MENENQENLNGQFQNNAGNEQHIQQNQNPHQNQLDILNEGFRVDPNYQPAQNELNGSLGLMNELL